jgi:hypothetical protein
MPGRADRCVDIPLHQVHQVERFGVVEELLMTFDPGHGYCAPFEANEFMLNQELEKLPHSQLENDSRSMGLSL